ncbi:MAG: hypothetical protein NTW83_02775 [Cyanobacteria bacterium]|nr:hypothetical protein [Cyanobacteriota bacterium]
MSNFLARPAPVRDLLLRRLLLLILDAGLILLCFWLAFALRLNDPLAPWFARNLYLAVWAVVLGLPMFLLSGWYRGLTRYSGSHSLYSFLPRSGLLVLLLLLVSTLSGNPTPPFRGFWIFYWVLLSAS